MTSNRRVEAARCAAALADASAHPVSNDLAQESAPDLV